MKMLKYSAPGLIDINSGKSSGGCLNGSSPDPLGCSAGSFPGTCDTGTSATGACAAGSSGGTGCSSGTGPS